MVLELIAPEFGNLAGPPSLVSCTRDVYAAGTTFGLAAALGLARGIAAAAGHLHDQGILHGDLYAHNILHTPAGEALLGDFGAACFFDPAKTATATALQQLEVRAFGCLLEELLTHCAAANTDAAPDTVAALWALQRQCVGPVVSTRPLFAEVSRLLAAAERLS